MKILHVITGLRTGGAEMMLYKLVVESQKMGHQNEVVSLTNMGHLSEKFISLNVPVHAVGLARSNPNPFLLWKLVKWIREFKPDVIQTWMYHADFFGGVVAKCFSDVPIVWDVQQSNFDPEVHQWTTFQIARLCGLISGWVPKKIVSCSEVAIGDHVKLGYREDKMLAIPNGFNVDDFKPDVSLRAEMRRELGIGDDAVLFGLVGRYDPQKDHKNFVEAAGKVAQQWPQAYFLMVGHAVDRENEVLYRQVQATGFEKNFFLMGRRMDMPKVMAAFDVGVLSSRGVEGFPNVLGEMMLCEVPCVTTNAGDSGLIVSDTGFVVPVQNSDALAEAMKKMVEIGSEGRRSLGQKARRRVCENYQITDVVRRYLDLYSSLA